MNEGLRLNKIITIIFFIIFALITNFAWSGGMSAKSIGEPAESPKINALKNELEKGNTKALDEFWKDIKKTGAPIFENIPEDKNNVLVTFIWEEKEKINNVAICFTDIKDFETNQMQKLLNTNLWYKTFKTKGNIRNTYALSPNEPLKNGSDFKGTYREWLAYQTKWKTDPLNPGTFIDDPAPYGSGISTSVIVGPTATPHPYLYDIKQADVLQGKVDSFSIASKIMNEDRPIWIYTPADFKPGNKQKYPFLVQTDGETFVKIFPQNITLDNLIAKKEIPPVIAVFIGQETPQGKTRGRDLAHYQPFEDFVVKELLPWIKEHYPITEDPSKTIISGSSLGGLFATCMAFKHSDIFGNVLSLSGAVYGSPKGEEENWIIRQYAHSKKLPVKFYLSSGLLETFILVPNRHFRDVLEAKNYTIYYREFNGTHCYFPRQGEFAEALRLFIGKNPIK